MVEEITGKTIRIPRQMVAEWDGIFDRARAELGERLGIRPESVTVRQAWGEVLSTLGQRYLLGNEPQPATNIDAKLDLVLDRLDEQDRRYEEDRACDRMGRAADARMDGRIDPMTEIGEAGAPGADVAEGNTS